MEGSVGVGVQPSLHDLARAVLQEQFGEGRVAEGRRDVQKGAVARCHCVHRLDADLGGVGKASFEDEANFSVPCRLSDTLHELWDDFHAASWTGLKTPSGYSNRAPLSMRKRTTSSESFLGNAEERAAAPAVSMMQGCSARRDFIRSQVGSVVALTVNDGRFDELPLGRSHVGALLPRPVKVLDGLPDPFDALFAGGFFS